jgi:hypothetical protein
LKLSRNRTNIYIYIYIKEASIVMNIPKLFASYSKFIFGEDLKLVIKKQIKSQETNYI